MSPRTHLLVIAAGAVLAGCGGDEPAETARTSTPEPTATATASPVPTGEATATPTASPAATESPAPGSDEGGDEAGNRVHFALRLGPGEVIPARTEVQAFLGLRLEVRNESGGERIVRLAGEPVLELLPGEADVVDLEGLRPGEHAIDAGASGRATIVAVRAGG